MSFRQKFKLANLETCMRVKAKRTNCSGPYSGEVVCEVCKEVVATTGHHLIITRAKMVGCPEPLKMWLARQEVNISMVCFNCHHDNIENLRDWLITEVSYRIYGEEFVKEWVQDVERRMGVPVPLPGRLCRWCRLSYDSGCPYDECDGRNCFERMSMAEMRRLGRLGCQ